ncbi:MAG: hypothetical protein HYR62_02810 [Actinobacteria bacterium]|nr:hypothetical protein [Actinomycetota bacterium]MBI3687403.1 hypothetical protein [Actinomycetota bacterium]
MTSTTPTHPSTPPLPATPVLPTTPAPVSPPTGGLRVGQPVHVNTHATWLPGVVTFLAGTRIGVRTQPPAGHMPFSGVVAPWVVRPARGASLRPVAHLRGGDVVLAHDGTTHTIATLRPATFGGRWLLTYTSGHRVSLPATAVLRLTQATTPRPAAHRRRAGG